MCNGKYFVYCFDVLWVVFGILVWLDNCNVKKFWVYFLFKVVLFSIIGLGIGSVWCVVILVVLLVFFFILICLINWLFIFSIFIVYELMWMDLLVLILIFFFNISLLIVLMFLWMDVLRRLFIWLIWIFLFII